MASRQQRERGLRRRQWAQLRRLKAAWPPPDLAFRRPWEPMQGTLDVEGLGGRAEAGGDPQAPWEREGV